MSPWVADGNVALATDFYELTMAHAYHAADNVGPATFDLFVRDLPDHRRFLVAAGLASALDALEAMRFGPDAIAYLRSSGRFTEGFLDYLAGWRFTGSVWGMAEGEVVFPDEPILRVTAPLPEAQLVETFLLNTIGFQTMIASKAARVAIAAGDRNFVDFSARRDHGADAALKGARAAYIGGAAATSMTLAGQLYGIPVSGTMAHSFVMGYDDEAAAFRDFARQFPDSSVLLIDTYDTEEGAAVAARVATDLASEGVEIRGVRLDSGDVAHLSRRVRAILDEAGHPGIQIFASGDLDEWRIAELVAAGSPIDAFGVGTRMGTSHDAPSLNVVYKLVATEDGPVVKLSAGKATMPGRKQVWRHTDHDLIGLDWEHAPTGRPLLTEVMVDGARAGPSEPLAGIRQRRAAAVAALPDRLRRLTGPEEAYPVRISAELAALTEQTQRAHAG